MDRNDTQNKETPKQHHSSGLEHSVFLDPTVWGWRLLVRILIVLNVLGVLGIALISYQAEKYKPVTATPCPTCAYSPNYFTVQHWQIKI